MTTALFLLALAALSALNMLLLLTIRTDIIRLWPTPGQGSWQNRTFWPLFRGGLGLTVALGIWQFVALPDYAPERLIGVTLALVALAVTIYGYFDLGIENTYGADDTLVTTGLYRYSRNPQYVASIGVFWGWPLRWARSRQYCFPGWPSVSTCSCPLPRSPGWAAITEQATTPTGGRRRAS